MFIDEVLLKVEAGKGGDGCSSFRHEKFIEMGGPDGGNGGKGGDIIFVADEGLKTLIDLRYMKHVKGNKGENGKGANKTGAQGEDVYIKVPIGTTVKDEGTGLIVCDLTKDKEEAVVAKGGKGGKGNAAFKSNKTKAPTTSEYGEKGEERVLKCELKLLADIGLVGFPSVGKSSLISVMSSAKPKIADYPFTTLTPNLGVVKVGEGKSFVLADLPGIIEGASEGIGLGDKFLKHASRCRVIGIVLDMSGTLRDVNEEYDIVKKELKNYSEKLYNKKSVVIANKMDYESAEENLDKFKKEHKDVEVIEVSAVTLSGIEELKYKLYDLYTNSSSEEMYDKEETESYVLYEFKNEKPYEIIKENDHTYILKGEKLENLLRKTKFNGEEAELRFARKLKNLGVDEELSKMGAKEGDTVKILDYEFEYEERLSY